MEQSRSWEANISLARIDIPRILWDFGVYFLVNNSLQLDPTLRQTNPVQAVPAYKFKIYLAYLAIHALVFFPSCYTTKSPHALLFSPREFQMYRTSHPKLSDGPNTCEKRKSVLSSRYSSAPFSAILSTMFFR